MDCTWKYKPNCFCDVWCSVMSTQQQKENCNREGRAIIILVKDSPVLLRIGVHGANPSIRIIFFYWTQLEGECPPFQTQICKKENTPPYMSATPINNYWNPAPHLSKDVLDFQHSIITKLIHLPYGQRLEQGLKILWNLNATSPSFL